MSDASDASEPMSEEEWSGVDAGPAADPGPGDAPGVIGSWPHLPRPDLIVPEAYDEHPLRIPRHLAAATGASLEDVLRRFDELFNGAE